MTNSLENPVFELATAYQKTAALVAAVKLNLFTIIGTAEKTAPQDLASKTGASARGLRILCDYLTVVGLLSKENSQYTLTQISRSFLDQSASVSLGPIVDFVAAPEIIDLFLRDPAAYVRRGGSNGLGSMSPEHPIWTQFANAAVPFAATTAKRVAGYVASFSDLPYTVLDIAAGHGLFGIEVAKVAPEALITAMDWAEVLKVARSNAEAAGVADRFCMLPGDALNSDWGSDFDLILLANFLHHFDFDTCTSLLRKARAGLSAGGQVLGIDLVPNEDRVSPPIPAMFALWMLATTAGGDAYTANELNKMAQDAGFSRVTIRSLAPTPESLIIFEN